jgi:L-rhamnose mutarotase
MNRYFALCATAALMIGSMLAGTAVAADRPYTEGPVSVITSIRTEPGMFDEYVKWLAGPWKQGLEAEKAAGVIVDYAVYSAAPRGPDDPNLYLITTYKNMAALDNLEAKTDAIYEKLMGSMQQQNEAAIARGKMRTVLGDELVRELKLK